jgi:hypothetical protein
MIGKPLVLIRCDGPRVADPLADPCRAARVAEIGWGMNPAHVATVFNAAHRDWLIDCGHVRCPACLARDGIQLGETGGQ